ncbi:hypothetical protein P7H00_00360 [Enterococcus pseudoavium]|uniref:Uncharacterized protein n=1 Tax=Enterococcus pseudoavium TaxID=44007 RepID=A0AAE4HZ30_9ENTE|nr:hypothetical protein [Enterococcus pseudoavium]MDT2735583.1 hypothetical protein [Enterococcus pseudoavium]MDT2754549.1 hypothetical protein [Enterococcus pseudoavium]MDT2769395.1 hypothetical protein [Enterococcus pseudoavium]REC31113.1 hypothetical protein CF160_01060 [Enterococcus pseudoavium]
MQSQVDITLWNIQTSNVVTALEDFIEDWKVSKNSDLDEYLRSYPGYFKSDEPTREAIRLVLGYGKELMDGTRDNVGFYENKIWRTESGESVRMTHFHERTISGLMQTIIKARG